MYYQCATYPPIVGSWGFCLLCTLLSSNLLLASYSCMVPLKDTCQLSACPSCSWLEEGSTRSILSWYDSEQALLKSKWKILESNLLIAQQNKELDRLIELLIEREALQRQRVLLEGEFKDRILQLRFKRSIEMLKLLYEKILSMDHHFAGMKAHEDISNLSNPQFYPEFRLFQTRLEEKAKKKHLVSLSPFFQANPYIATAFSIFSLLQLTADASDPEQDQVKCILDFTVGMHQNLQIIYHELTFLKDANQALLANCEQLFTDCSKTVGYHLPLSYCREQDDWEHLFQKLSTLFANVATSDRTLASSENFSVQTEKIRMALQFSIDRVATFTERYSQFVQQGTEYYKKFSRILGAYHPGSVCAPTAPAAFLELKTDIQTTLEKFKTAYQIPEIQGSKLKEMRYGIPDN